MAHVQEDPRIPEKRTNEIRNFISVYIAAIVPPDRLCNERRPNRKTSRTHRSPCQHIIVTVQRDHYLNNNGGESERHNVVRDEPLVPVCVGRLRGRPRMVLPHLLYKLYEVIILCESANTRI